MQNREVHTRESFIEVQLDTVSPTARSLLPLVGSELWYTQPMGEVDSKQRGNCCDGSIVQPEEILQRIHPYPEALAFVFSGGDIAKLMIAV